MPPRINARKGCWQLVISLIFHAWTTHEYKKYPLLISETDPGEGSSSCGGGGGSGGGIELREENARLQREITELKCLLGPEALALSAELKSTRDALACE